jgi:F-type H+-transporting ATPase subunit a
MIVRQEHFGTHPTVDFGCGTLCIFNYDSLISSAVAILATIAVGFWLRSKLKTGEPGKVQAVFEWGYDQLRSLIRANVSHDALFIIPLALTLFLYILVANWIEILPLAVFPLLHGANADLNQTLAMALIVIGVVQWYSVRVLGWRGYFRRFTKPFEMPLAFRIGFMPFNILEEVVKPVTLSLRLFGNIFAGGVMIALIAGFGSLALPLVGTVGGTVLGTILLAVWKAFDVIFIGFIQAFIFMLLTVIYFGMAREGLEHEEHGTSTQERAGKMLTTIQEGSHD